MSASADIHATLASILERFAKCALLEMSRAVEQEMTRRKMEVETLMLKLQFTESELRSARQNQSNLRSVGTQFNSSGQREVNLNCVKINENHDGASRTETHTDVSSAQSFTQKEDGIKSIQIKEEHMEDEQWDSGPISPALCPLGPEVEDQDSFSTGTTGASRVGSDFILTSKMKPGGMWNSPVSEEYPVNSGALSLDASPLETGVTAHSREAQADHHSQEKIVVKNLSEEKAHFSHAANVNSQLLKQEESVTQQKKPEEEELSGLEFEMKIEQVEKLVDQALNQVQAKQKFKGQNHCHDGNSRLWSSGKVFDDPESVMESEQHSQSFTDPYVMEDPMTTSTQSGLLAVLQNESFGVADIDYDLNFQDSHRSSPSTSESESTAFNTLPSSHSSSCLPQTFPQSLNAGKHTEPKPFRCEECGKGFPQKGRLLTHRLVHMDEKPFRCEECGKSFTQRKRLLTHRLVHTGEKPFRCHLCGKTFSRQDNCLRHMRLHSDCSSSSNVYLSP